MDKYTLILIGIVLALAFFAWLDHREAKKPTATPPKKAMGTESSDSYMTERMGAGYVGIFDRDD